MPADALALARSILDASAQASAAGCPTSPREVWRLGCPDRLDVLVALEQLAAPSPAVEAHLAAASREVDAWVRERYRGGAGGAGEVGAADASRARSPCGAGLYLTGGV